MLFHLIFRFWFALALHVYAIIHAWMPTSHLVRWVNTDSGIKWGLPTGAALTPLYYLAMTWSGRHLNVDGSNWWWVLTLWGAMNTIKFAHVAIRSPFVWVRQTLRQNHRAPVRGIPEVDRVVADGAARTPFRRENSRRHARDRRGTRRGSAHQGRTEAMAEPAASPSCLVAALED